ncbi:hypothetical protein [Microvirga zambiensis]|uniref:hypothetical protein n=1 Tax=Microvirga zambiensis TaxID=1402137 RepID=UPI00191D8322|nr:hypothetical protein [Microvirga zambiensis]
MKFVARSLGLLLIAAGFIGLVIDGTWCIVNNDVSFATIGKVIGVLVPGGVAGLEGAVAQRGYPWLWDPIVTSFLQMPASLTGFVIGVLLMWIGQKPLEPIGYLAER